MSFIKKLRLSKRLPSVLSKPFNNSSSSVGGKHGSPMSSPSPRPPPSLPSPGKGLLAISDGQEATVINGTLNESGLNATIANNNTTLNTTYTTTSTSESLKGSKSHKSSAGTRCLVIYHIDSETEGTWSLTVRVSSSLDLSKSQSKGKLRNRVHGESKNSTFQIQRDLFRVLRA